MWKLGQVKSSVSFRHVRKISSNRFVWLICSKPTIFFTLWSLGPRSMQLTCVFRNPLVCLQKKLRQFLTLCRLRTIMKADHLWCILWIDAKKRKKNSSNEIMTGRASSRRRSKTQRLIDFEDDTPISVTSANSRGKRPVNQNSLGNSTGADPRSETPSSSRSRLSTPTSSR